MSTVAQTMRELEELKHERAVWMELVEHLSRFVDHEVKQADSKIVAEGCISPHVPQELVQRFIDSINENEIEPLNESISALENLGVEQEDEQEEADEEKPARRKKAGKANAGKEAGKSGKGNRRAKKQIRAVPKPSKTRSQNAG